MSDDLDTWLNEQLDADERAALAWLPLGNPTAADRAHIARRDPSRVLAKVDAQRALISLHAELIGRCTECESGAPCPVKRQMAREYADRPGYRPEWRP